MVYALCRSVGAKESLAIQEGEINRYLQSKNLKSKAIFTEFSSLFAPLEEREEMMSFMHQQEDGGELLVSDIWVLSNSAEDLVKVFTCLFKKNITLHIIRQNVIINKESSAFLVLGIINEVRELNIQERDKRGNGRPKGSISKSIFDTKRGEIIKMLGDGKNVSKISRELQVNRSSLKDFINSRGLKELAINNGKVGKFEFDEKLGSVKIIERIECPFKNKIKKESK